jgi:hypothetical protein
LNAGSYLTFSIANRWIRHLSYVYPTCSWSPFSGEPEQLFGDGFPPDLNRFLFRNQEFESGLIELQQLDEHGCRELMLGGTSYTPLSVEPPVPIEFIGAKDFCKSGFTHMILAHSEEYCPRDADVLLPVIGEYFRE